MFLNSQAIQNLEDLHSSLLHYTLPEQPGSSIHIIIYPSVHPLEAPVLAQQVLRQCTHVLQAMGLKQDESRFLPHFTTTLLR